LHKQAPDYNFAPDKPKLVAGGIGGAFTNLLANSYGVSAVMDWKDRAVPPQGGTFSTAELDEIYRMGTLRKPHLVPQGRACIDLGR
jgi:hypothetical protein